jgi:two-component system chemotaxis response regulator CheY
MPDSLNLKGLTFLLADSDSFFIRLVRGILRNFGATHIVSETDGQRAFDLAGASLVDMVICDAFLPRLDGFQLCRAIRQDDDQALRFVPVIILTSHTQSQNV